jgi:hypothetical protein
MWLGTYQPHDLMFVLDLGVWSSESCGVRNFADELRRQMTRQGVDSSGEWTRIEAHRFAGISSMARWLLRWRRRVQQERPDVIVWHYSVFSYAYRGIPILSPLVALTLCFARPPVVLVLHEFAYPWGRRGWRGTLLAIAQRVALVAVIASASAAIVTTEPRQTWLQDRRWLAKRPMMVAPVFAALPVVEAKEQPPDDRCSRATIGIFGYGAESADETTATIAINEVVARHPDLTLLLLGGPGPDSFAAKRWRSALERHDCAANLRFSGVLPQSDLSREISRTPLFLSPHRTGPTSRKTTLAALLEHGRAIVAMDGPERWMDLVDDQAVCLAPLDPRVIARDLCVLIDDPVRREGLAKRARAFSLRRLDPSVIAGEVVAFLQRVATSHPVET